MPSTIIDNEEVERSRSNVFIRFRTLKPKFQNKHSKSMFLKQG